VFAQLNWAACLSSFIDAKVWRSLKRWIKINGHIFINKYKFHIAHNI
jgi:hypothetical protein